MHACKGKDKKGRTLALASPTSRKMLGSRLSSTSWERGCAARIQPSSTPRRSCGGRQGEGRGEGRRWSGHRAGTGGRAAGTHRWWRLGMLLELQRTRAKPAHLGLLQRIMLNIIYPHERDLHAVAGGRVSAFADPRRACQSSMPAQPFLNPPSPPRVGRRRSAPTPPSAASLAPPRCCLRGVSGAGRGGEQSWLGCTPAGRKRGGKSRSS